MLDGRLFGSQHYFPSRSLLPFFSIDH
uniref:Uncharacterized protein n=1 Tax=Arundo donax TaxID=35708 RepID=A0A0A9ASJ3_ARUDO